MSQIEEQLELNRTLLEAGPLRALVSLLEECNELLAVQEGLKKKIADTEAVTLLQGNSLEQVMSAYRVLSQKVDLLEALTLRRDLEQEQKQKLFDQLQSFRSTRDTLQLSIDACFWETELLE